MFGCHCLALNRFHWVTRCEVKYIRPIMNNMTVLDFLRHGEVEGGDYYRGITDDALTDKGWGQMHRQCDGRRWDAVISSPLRRCASFASAWCHQRQQTLEIEPVWREIDFGDWEGLTAEQIASQEPGALQAFYQYPGAYTPPNGEAYADFLRRIQQGWDDVLKNHAGNKS